MFLGAEIAAPIRDGSIGGSLLHVRSWNRDDGTPATAQPVEEGRERCAYTTLIVVPSALLMVCTPRQYDKEPTTVVGYVSETG
ncbi:hypothetical protein HLB23_23920 [Nocardia uniformis]|uniref:Uncharacterized protein n=1 Tax=Nocardia uniformis TaxID=53432 RepID=A0A849C518_9NOCA|nr:hypothetical protein [Nocardia uniformis]NNH72868.1 hypothetical protein [Nocardia uniformis]